MTVGSNNDTADFVTMVESDIAEVNDTLTIAANARARLWDRLYAEGARLPREQYDALVTKLNDAETQALAAAENMERMKSTVLDAIKAAGEVAAAL